MRYSVPDRLIKQIWENEDFFSACCKHGGIAENRFPKNDQWIDDEGFHMSFALAGYGPEDILIEILSSTLTLFSNGIQEISPEQPEIKDGDDAMSEYSKKAKPAIQKGSISRGIARRSFKISYSISDQYDCYEASAGIEYGLLHIIIPPKKNRDPKTLRINYGMENKI